MLEQITETLLDLVDQVGLVGIFIATMVESFFAPIPSEVVLFTGGLYAKAQGGIVSLLLVAVVASFGSFFGTLPFYLVSRFSAENWLPRFIKRFGKYLLISTKDIEKSHKYFEKKGNITVFIARLIPGIRSLIAFPAGLAKMNFLAYTFFTLAGSFLWNMLLATIGYLAYDKQEEFFKLIDPVEKIIIFALALAVLIYCYKLIRNFQKIQSEESIKN